MVAQISDSLAIQTNDFSDVSNVSSHFSSICWGKTHIWWLHPYF